MADSFAEISHEIAEGYIRNVVVVDDEASYSESTETFKLHAGEVVEAFAASGKLCSVYKVTREQDEDNVLKLAKKADVIVLDWRIGLEEPSSKGIVGDEEEDVEIDDVRGRFALGLIRKLVEEEDAGLKLILVYSGETDLAGITETIAAHLNASDIEFDKNEFNLSLKNLRISVYGKGTLKNKKLNEQAQTRIVEYDQLPDKIIEEFAELASGIVAIIALKSISLIRENASKLLTTFNSSLDPAFLSHKALLPAPADALDQLLEVIGLDVQSLILNHNSVEIDMDEMVKLFIKDNYEENVVFNFAEKEKFKVLKIPETISNEDLTTVTKFGIEKYFNLNKMVPEDRILFQQNCQLKLIESYANDGAKEENLLKTNIAFSRLTTLKNFYLGNYVPILTQGTILKDENAKSNFRYWLCIQPQCDCVRIKTKKHPFLFLWLREVPAENHHEIVLDKDTYLKIIFTPFKAKFFSFEKNDEGVVKPTVEGDGKRIFARSDAGSKLKWIGELKDDFAQAVSNDFAAKIARVGTDHSEWLRRS